jgi:hypothetical protein
MLGSKHGCVMRVDCIIIGLCNAWLLTKCPGSRIPRGIIQSKVGLGKMKHELDL